jgi:hypothetical protein
MIGISPPPVALKGPIGVLGRGRGLESARCPDLPGDLEVAARPRSEDHVLNVYDGARTSGNLISTWPSLHG